MALSYESLLSGMPIFVDGIGTFKPPKLKEINQPPQGIGTRKYNLFLSILNWTKDDLLRHSLKPQHIAILNSSPTMRNLSMFDLFMLETFPAMSSFKFEFPLKATLVEALSFFIIEQLRWDDVDRRFLTVDTNGKQIGVINNKNFDDVCDMVLQLNYMNKPKPEKFKNEKARLAWERAQKYEKQGVKKDNKRYTLGNIISKVATSGKGYDLFNIWDLTIYQTYNVFQEICHAKMSDLNLAAIANHGSEKSFDFQSFLDPVEK